MKVEKDGFSLDFTDAKDAFVFDEKDPNSPTCHGAPMKGVDVIAELDRSYVYVEIKDFSKKYDIDRKSETNGQEAFNQLKSKLKYKYRDSYLYRHAEHKVEKPIRYICLLGSFDNAMSVHMQKKLKHELPVGIPKGVSTRWKQAIVKSCQVVNLDRWNKAFPKWPARKLRVNTA